jgi:aminomethyltransferase
MKHTPLYQAHVELGAQLVEFAGYAMPVRYSSEKVEHMAVRQKAGLFDVSHMGEIFVRGPRASEAVDALLTNNISDAHPGQALYAAMLNEHAGIIDDVVAYKFSREKILICVNASNKEKDAAWIRKIVEERYSHAEAQVEDVSDAYAQLALQGPRAAEILQKIAPFKVEELARFHFCEAKLDVGEVIVARTGYTGEDGFEIFVAPEQAEALWKQLLEVGEPFGLIACGLSARDTLRLEAGMCLYGNDINDDTSPLEAGIGFAVKWNKATPFFGEQALAVQKEQGLSRKLVGLTLSDRNIARSGYEVLDEGSNPIGLVTSGTLSPFLNVPIAMAYVKKPFAEPGTTVYVKVRQNLAVARVTKLPFYKVAKT